MNRRELIRGVVGSGIMAALPLGVRAAEDHGDTPSALIERFQSDGVWRMAYRIFEGSLPASCAWLSAYGVVCTNEDHAQTVAAQMPRAIHDATAAKGERGTVIGAIHYTGIDTPGGADQAEGWTWTVGTDSVAMTMIRSGRWVQILYGPTPATLDGALSSLTALAAVTMTRWPTTTQDVLKNNGAWNAVPSLADLPTGVTIVDEVLYRG